MSNNQTKKGRPIGAKNKPKQPLNVGGQPNDIQTQKIFSETLSAKNIGVDKIILNVNGGNSELVTNRNSILKYSLKQPIQLEVGDTITCINAFVEEKGLAENTISFEEDLEAEMRFFYYKQGDTGDELSSIEDVGFCAYPKLFPDAFTSTNAGGSTGAERSGFTPSYLGGNFTYANLVGDLGLNMSFDGIGYGADVDTTHETNTNITTGCNGNYYYLMETVSYKKTVSNASIREFTDTELYQQFFMRPVYGSKRIKIKAGNYSVDSLANIISSQLNGSLGANNNEFSNALLDKLYNPNGVNKDSMISTYPYFKNIDTVDDSDQSDIIGNCGESTDFERRIDGFVKQLNISDLSYYECWAFQNIFSFFNKSVGNLDRLNDKHFPNGASAFTVTPGFNDPDDTVDLLDLLTPNDKYSNGKKNIHFYINKKAIDTFFETNDKWYNLPNLKTNGESVDNLFFPPMMYEVMYNTVDIEYGYIPRTSTNLHLPGNPYEKERRYVNGVDSLSLQQLYPVKGFAFPGSENILPQRNVFAGTSVAELTFGDAVSNRFALSNLHEFYKLPNLTADESTTTGYGGQQATKYNNPFYNDERTNGAVNNIAEASVDNAGPVYPVDSSSGVAINNFDFDLVKNTKIYKDLVAEIQSIDGNTAELQQVLYKEKLIYDLFTKPFDQFFASKSEAEAQWSKSLWSRLGFTYNQLGNVSENLETFIAHGTQNRVQTKQKGIITHNSFDFSKIVSSDGLGLGNPISKNGTPMQNYRLESYYNGIPFPGNLGVSGNNIHLLSDSKPINAEELPSLSNGKSYLLIESDIIKPNFKDNKANLGNLLAIMSKENATNDTIFGADPIDFVITEPSLLTDITIYIKNPDGTLAADNVIGANNGFLIQISKPIPITKLPSIQI
jgi:hypothetical protein